jgi:hypothetical protein
MHHSRSLPVVAVLLLAAALAACDVSVGDGGFSLGLSAGRAQDTWTRSYPLSPGGRLELINVNGRIDAEPSSGEAVELSAERTARAPSDDAARELLGRIEMREEVGPSRIRVEVRPPRSVAMSGAELRWTIKVPAGAVLDVRTVNGRIVLTGLAGEVRARTTNGGVQARRLAAARVDASTVNGGVNVELADPLPEEGDVSLEAVNGGVELALPGTSKASITARVTNGGINTTGLDLELTGEQSRRRLEGRLNGGGARVALSTTNGGVRISKTTASKATS